MLFKPRRRYWVARYFSALNSLQEQYFFCYLEQDYWHERHLYEWRIYHAHQKLFLATQKLRSINKTHDISCFEHLYELTCSLGHLRFRMSDRAVFELCKNEFLRITQLLTTTLHAASARRVKATNVFQSLEQLTAAVFDLEDLWQGALRVTAPEPLVFLFFIQDLNRWHQSMLALVKANYA
ncbi:MAG: hypothetical protein SFW66_09350 [Gammaproteobacteria bacterium]|nr:hypothetical protein [Gammaproteobacteria bacterium]